MNNRQLFREFISHHVELDSSAWDEISKLLHFKVIKKKQHFLKEGSICKEIGFLTKGYMRVYFLADGEEVTKDFNFENSFCGSYASFSMQLPSRFNVVAMEDARVCSLQRDSLFYLYEKFPAMQKLGRLSIEKMFIRKELREASFLLDDAKKRYENLLSDNPQILQRVPLKYIASYLGIRPETLSRLRAEK